MWHVFLPRPMTGESPMRNGSRANGRSSVSGRRLYEQTPKRPILQYFPVGDTVQSHSARHAQILRTCLAVEVINGGQQHFFQHALQTMSHILVELRYLSLRPSRRLAKQFDQGVGMHSAMAAEIEVLSLEAVL